MRVQPNSESTANTFTNSTRSPTTLGATVSSGTIATSGMSMPFMKARRVQPWCRYLTCVSCSRLVLRFRYSELHCPGGGAPLHVGRILLELNGRGADIEDQDHTSPLQDSGEPILCNE